MFGLEWQTLETWLGHFNTIVVAPIGFILAALVSMHVLLRKRDIGAAIGWIGLLWLSPFVGCGLYFVLGINRVERRARRLRRRIQRGEQKFRAPSHDIAAHLEPLESASRKLTRRTAEADNDVRMFENGDNAYPAMLAAIAEARTSVALGSYIFFLDRAGRQFTDAVTAAQQRGVAVRVMVDGVGSGYFKSKVYWQLRRASVPVARFLHSMLPWRTPFLNLRTHKKVLVVDGRVGFTGGLNIAEQNILALKPADPVQDLNFRFEGPVVAQLMDDFARDWEFATGETLDDTWFPDPSPAGEAVARVVTSGPDEDLEKIEFVIMEALALARTSIKIVTPYFLPEERLLTVLAIAAMRGVKVDVVVPEKSDHRFIDWAMYAHVGPLIDVGVRIWRNPPPFAHTKLLIIDDDWCLIGSANWDTRSMRLNFELSVEIYNCGLAKTLSGRIEHLKHNRITADEIKRRSLPVRLRDAAIRLFLPYL